MCAYVRLCALYVVFDMLCASRIIFGKISPLEMLFLSLFRISTLYYPNLTFRLSSYLQSGFILEFLEELRKPQQ